MGAEPGIVSRAEFCVVLYSSCATLLALYARSTGGLPRCKAHRMPLVLPFAEIVGLAPGKGYVSGEMAVGVVVHNPLLTLNDLTLSSVPMKYTQPPQYAGVL